MSRYTLAISGLICALLVGGCATAEPSVVPVSEAATPVPPTATPYPPTETPAPTATVIPPTPTSTPTATPVPPTVTPTFTPLPPLSGSGGGVITFSSDRSGRPGIYVMNADGSDQRLVTDEENAAHPAFSPDGTRIIYTSSAPNMGRVRTINVDGTDGQIVYSKNRAMGDPDWSPDGQKIVFVLHEILRPETPSLAAGRKAGPLQSGPHERAML